MGDKMEDLLQFVPEDKQTEFKTAAETYLSGYVKNDPDVLIDTVKSNQAVFDKITAGPMDSRLNNWKEKELPKLLKEEQEKIRKELAPKPESETDIKLRELTEKLEAKEKKEAEFLRRSELREKYKDIDPEIADQLYLLEDEPLNKVMEKYGSVKKELEELKKVVKYGGKPPEGGSAPGTREALLKRYNDLTAAGKREEANAIYIQLARMPQ